MAGDRQCPSSTWLCVRCVPIPCTCLYLEHFLSHHRHPSEPQCSYDPVEGLPLAPDIDPLEKIKDLEEQIST